MMRRYPAYRDSGVEWLGEVPEGWEVRELKRIASMHYGDALASDIRDDGGDFFVYGSNGPVGLHSAANALGPAVLVGRKGSYGALNWSERDCFAIDTVYFIDRTATASHLRWLFYALHLARFEGSSQDTGVPGLSRSVAYSTQLPLPPLAEQTAIAAFLDRETAKIDALVDEQRRLIALLREKRQAVISHAVTKGLNPAAPIKPSGVDWLGDVPEGWEVVPLKRITTSYCDGPFGSGLKSDHYTESGTRVIRLQNIKSSGFNGTDEAFIEQRYAEEDLSRHAVVAGDLLIAGLGDEKNFVGRACVAPSGISPAIVKADCFRFRIDELVAIPDFVAHQLNCSAAYAAGTMANGTTRLRIPLSQMAERTIALPGRDIQAEVLASVGPKIAVANALTSTAESAITLLQERRAALISAAVTGKIDVRDLAPAQTEAA